MFYIESRGWDWRAAYQSTGLTSSQPSGLAKRAPRVQLELGPGLYR
jgi:hypothetical protein